ncbi:MAG: putative 7-carboxy-7-deazaguanine synthase QueE [Clostridium sp.]
MNFKVVEKFISVNGEGPLCGQLAIFIRFAGCNLNCSYCDTTWANDKNVPYELINSNDLYNYIKSTKINNVTLTGGEPLINSNILGFIEILSKDSDLHVEIETNGSVLINKFSILNNPPSFTVDYKLPSSNMEDKMNLDNFEYLTTNDTLKFVCGTLDDLNKANYIINKYNLTNKCKVYISPVFGKLKTSSIVDFMKNNNMNKINLQLQIHKIIWDENKRGV